MRSCVVGLICLIACCAAASAQELPRYNGHGSVFFSGSRVDGAGVMDLGVGGRGLVYKGLGVGAELGYAFAKDEIRYGFGLLSVNSYYHFVRRERPARLVPFLTGGWSLGFRGDAINLVNYGGGVTWWMRPKLGMQFEVREHFRPEHSEYYSYYTAFRVGLSFG